MSSKVNLSVLLFINATIVFAAPVNTNIPVDKFNASLGLAIENSDNIFLTPTNRKSDNIFHEIFSANYTRNSPAAQTKFSLNADHQHYQNKSFADQTIYTSSLEFNTNLIKDRLTWNVSDQFQRVPVNQLVPADLPTNQQNVNYFNTGPTFVVLRDDRQLLNLGLNYNKTYAQKTEIDSSGYKAEAAYSRNLTRTFTMKLNLNHNVRNYANSAVNTDYSRTDSTITLSKRMKLSEIYLTGGRSIIVRENASNYANSIFRAGYKYQLGEKASLKMNYDRELGDYSGLLANTITSNEALPSVNSDIFIMEQGDISIARNFGNSSIAYQYSYFTANYSNQVLNYASKISQLSYTDKLSTALVFSLSGTYQINTYTISARKDTLSIYAGSLSKKMARVYDLAFKFQYLNRNSNLAPLVYDERRILISGAYHF